MPATSTVNPTADPYVNGVLSGIKWAVNSLTFSFPTDPSYYGSGYGNGEPYNGFEAFNSAQKIAVRAILDQYSAVANVTFTEVTETASQHGDLRYAESSAPSTAWAYYPSTNPAGGDSWFSHSYYNTPLKGNYAFLTMIHETGHAMGLKHPHEARGSFGSMPADKDSLEYSVMSYHSYVGSPTTGYTVANGSYPQTLMMYDIAGLQAMYGANYSTNAGDTVYRWSPTTGEISINGSGQGAPLANKIFMTIWDGGGEDTYDFSNFTNGVNVNLAPGAWSTTSATQLANLGNGNYAAGNIANALLYNNNPASLIENAIGGSGNDTLTGNIAANKLTGGSGNDVLDGKEGSDTAVYSGLKADYLVVENPNQSWTVTDLRLGSPDGTDTLWNIEWLKFSDQTVAIGTPSSENYAPVAGNDGYTTVAETDLIVPVATGVLANDSDPENDPLSAILVNGPSNGALTLAADGSFVFTPNAGFAGTDSFSYKANDGGLDSNVATVSITVEPPPNVAPEGTADSYTTAKRTKLVVDATKGVLANDYDADGNSLNAVLVSNSKDGNVTLDPSGAFTFTPKGKFTGTTSFTYVANDGWANSDPVTVTIAVTGSGGGGGGGGKGNKGKGKGSGQQVFTDQAPAASKHAALTTEDQSLLAFDLDQIPAPLGSSSSLGLFEQASFLQLFDDITEKPKFDFGQDQDHNLDLTGLPDFMHIFYSEFTLTV